MDQNCDLFFPFPEQKEADRGEIKLILDIFNKTLNDLPWGNQENVAKAIFDILYKSNKIQFKCDDRLTLIKKIEGPALQVVNGLRDKIKDVTAPIGRNEERFAKILVGIHYELALAYRCLLEKQPVKLVLRNIDKDVTANNIRLAIYHLGEILRTKYSVFSNPSGTIWKYVYTLFICAYNQHIHNVSLPDSDWCRFNTVEDVFKSILLMSISSPLTMRGNEFNALYDLAPDLAQYIELGKINCGENYSDLMTFNLSGTEAPKKQFATGCDSCSNASNCFTVSTTQLLDYFERQQDMIEENEQPTQVQRFLNTQGQFEKLKRNLTGFERSCDSKRTKGGSFLVELVVGFSDVYTFLSKGATKAAVNKEQNDALSGTDNWENTGEDTINVEDIEAWTTTGIIRSGLRKTICKVINHSSGGYCLYLDASERFHLRVGELAIVKESGKSEWNVAVIIWVRGNKKRVDFGVKLLEGVVSTGTLKPVYSKGTDISTECLFLKTEYGDDDSSIRIVTASPDIYNGDKLLVNYHNHEYRVTVINTDSKTNGYVEYICDWSDSEEDVAKNQSSNPKDAVVTESDFESIWDQL